MFQQAHLAVDKKKKCKVDNKTRVSIYLIIFLIVVALVDQIIRGRSIPGLEHTCLG